MTTVDLPHYNPDARCPKCDHDTVTTGYQRNAHCTHYPDKCVMADVHEPDCCTAEHLHRRCGRCQYWWAESVFTIPPSDRMT